VLGFLHLLVTVTMVTGDIQVYHDDRKGHERLSIDEFCVEVKM